MDYTTCPACSSDKVGNVPMSDIRTCRSCGAIFGDVTEKVASNFANYGPMSTGSLADHGAVFCFDFTVRGQRRHGWTNSAHEVVQTG